MKHHVSVVFRKSEKAGRLVQTHLTEHIQTSKQLLMDVTKRIRTVKKIPVRQTDVIH